MIKHLVGVFIFCLLLVATACSRKSHSQNSKSKTDCVQEKISSFSRSACKDGASVKEYVFQGKKVYAFDQGTCGADFTTEVMDSECKSLGFLGGITGNTRINDEDFSKAEFTRLLWESNAR